MRPDAPAALAEAHLRLALAARQPEAALGHLAEALRAAPDDARLHAHLALAAWRGGDLPRAATAAAQAAALAPAEPRYREMVDLLEAMTGRAPAEGHWRTDILAAIAAAQELPVGRADAPAWVSMLLATAHALVAKDWAGALAHALRGLGTSDLPAAAADALRYYAAAAQAGAGRWEAVIAGLPAGGVFAARAGALRRAAAAQLLTAAADGGVEPSAAQTALEILESAGGLPREVRDRLAATVGLLHAGRQEWAEAVRLWRSAERRFDLLQPLALACENMGEMTEARQRWERLAERVRRGWDGLPPGASPQHATATVYDHLAELATRDGDAEAAARFAEQALAFTPEAPADRHREVAVQILRVHEAASPGWERGAALLETAAALDPRDLDTWRHLAQVRRIQGRWQEALDAARRWQGSGRANPREVAALVEDFGRAIIEALSAAQWAEAERLAGEVMALTGAPAACSAGSSAEFVGELALAAVDRARGTRRRRPALGRWRDALREEVGGNVPLSAFALRGFLFLVGGRANQAERLFRWMRLSEVWDDAPEAAQIDYLRWMGHAECWARQLRARGTPLQDCGTSPECGYMLNRLVTAACLRPDRAPPEVPPPCLRGCPHVAEVYRRGARECRSAQRAMRRSLRLIDGEDADDLG